MGHAAIVPVSVSLRVRSLDRELRFYVDGLGLEPRERDGAVELAPPGAPAVVRLVDAPDAPLRPPATVGLYHLALLVPERRDLGRVVERIREAGIPFEGFADHGVSEAAYLRDPEGNGVELYADRPSEAWPRDDESIAMVTRPLDVPALVDEAGGPAGLPDGTTLGHLHFHVASLEATEAFYGDGLGLAVTQRSYPGALFLASASYHHHVGANTWAGERRAPDEATGLVEHAWRGPADAVTAAIERLERAGTPADPSGGHWRLADPARATLVLEAGP